jgi:hypothetical protein
MQRKLTVIVAALMLAAAVPVLAQSKGPNGGLLSGTKGHQTELIVSSSELTVFLLDDGKPHESKGTKMRAVIQQAGKTTTLNFVDHKGEKLVAKLSAPLENGAIVVLTGKDHHGDQINTRYVIK